MDDGCKIGRRDEKMNEILVLFNNKCHIIGFLLKNHNKKVSKTDNPANNKF
jgi:hypothetical protein